MALAPIVAPFAGGVLQTFFGWRVQFRSACRRRLRGDRCGVVACCRRRCERARPSRFRALPWRGSIGTLAQNRIFLAYLGISSLAYLALFAWLSGSSFVLQDIHGLSPIGFAWAFAVGLHRLSRRHHHCGTSRDPPRDRSHHRLRLLRARRRRRAHAGMPGAGAGVCGRTLTCRSRFSLLASASSCRRPWQARSCHSRTARACVLAARGCAAILRSGVRSACRSMLGQTPMADGGRNRGTSVLALALWLARARAARA